MPPSRPTLYIYGPAQQGKALPLLTTITDFAGDLISLEDALLDTVKKQTRYGSGPYVVIKTTVDIPMLYLFEVEVKSEPVVWIVRDD